MPATDLVESESRLDVIVLRPERLLDTMFSVSIIILLAILFINFGAALNMTTIKSIMKRPVSPAIGSVCQMVFMPLMAYGLGIWLFPNDHELALGLFLCGITPAGGASNIYALLLGGNIDLSISMTTISTLAAFGTMPMWLFTLGATIFARANLGIPYLRVLVVAISLLFPLVIGLLIQKCLPRVAKFLVRILKPLALVFIIIIIVFAFFVNLYMLQLVTPQVNFVNIRLPLNINVTIFRSWLEDFCFHSWGASLVGLRQKYFGNHHLIPSRFLSKRVSKIRE